METTKSIVLYLCDLFQDPTVCTVTNHKYHKPSVCTAYNLYLRTMGFPAVRSD